MFADCRKQFGFIRFLRRLFGGLFRIDFARGCGIMPAGERSGKMKISTSNQLIRVRIGDIPALRMISSRYSRTE